MNCGCHDDHPFMLFGKFLGDNCVGLTGWGFGFMLAAIILIGLVVVPALGWASARFT